jgi:hypothetical protein
MAAFAIVCQTQSLQRPWGLAFPGGDPMAHRLRIAHVGSGRTGRIVLRLILNSPALDLVSQYLHSPEKVGRDSGELVGEAPTGIIATQDFDAFVASEADCVTYLATGMGRAVHDVIDQHSAIPCD